MKSEADNYRCRLRSPLLPRLNDDLLLFSTNYITSTDTRSLRPFLESIMRANLSILAFVALHGLGAKAGIWQRFPFERYPRNTIFYVSIICMEWRI